MDRKSKLFFVAFFLMISASVIITYYKYMVLKDYLIEAEIPCDPAAETCFIYECNPEAEECSEDPAENISYYKLITKKAFLFPDCDPNDETCPPLECKSGEEECEVTLCEDSTVEEGVTCNNPEEYLINNPPEEEALDESEVEDSVENKEVEDDGEEAAISEKGNKVENCSDNCDNSQGEDTEKIVTDSEDD